MNIRKTMKQVHIADADRASRKTAPKPSHYNEGMEEIGKLGAAKYYGTIDPSIIDPSIHLESFKPS